MNVGIISPPAVLTGLPSAPTDGSYRLETNGDGTFLQLYNPTQSQWHTVFIQGGSGAETLAIGPASS